MRGRLALALLGPWGRDLRVTGLLVGRWSAADCLPTTFPDFRLIPALLGVVPDTIGAGDFRRYLDHGLGEAVAALVFRCVCEVVVFR